MTRTTIPLPIADLSRFARSLAAELKADLATEAKAEPPGHLRLLNMLARASGFRNFQHLRASQKAGEALSQPPEAPPDLTRVQSALRHFDAAGLMTTWPARTAIQHLCLWALWSRLPSDVMTERQISQHLNQMHSFGDPALLRRTLCELRLVTRAPGASAYTKLPQTPPPEARALFKALPISSRQKYPTGGGGGA